MSERMKMSGQRNMPKTICVIRENSSQDSDDHHWLLVDDFQDALNTACGPVYVGEYKLVRAVKVSEGKPVVPC